MKAVRTIDNAVFGILLVEGINSTIATLTKQNPAAKLTTRRPSLLRTYYSLVGLATVYRAFRTFGPKTKDERRIAKMAHFYDKAGSYGHRAQHYRKAAQSMLHQLRSHKAKHR